jgi:agmatinase
MLFPSLQRFGASLPDKILLRNSNGTVKKTASQLSSSVASSCLSSSSLLHKSVPVSQSVASWSLCAAGDGGGGVKRGGGRQQLHRQQVRYHNPNPFDPKQMRGWKAAVAEGNIPRTKMLEEMELNLANGLPGSSAIEDKTIPTFARGELPHFAGINTFLKAPYLENATKLAELKYDATVVGVPFDGGCTYRPGTRFGPQGIRRISALYTPYNYEKHIDLRESMSLCDIGDVFTIPANIEKSFAQISNAIAYIASTGTMPIILGGDHSIGYPTIRGIASVTSKNIGIIHVDRHADIQEKDLDERMHTTPYFHATNIRTYITHDKIWTSRFLFPFLSM